MRRWVMTAGLVLAAALAIAAETPEQIAVAGVLLEIRQAQGLPANGKIDCNRVTPAQYERLGETVLAQELPDSGDYAWLDNMMVGPTSEMARAMHRMVGARFLGCAYGGRAGFFYPWPGPMMGGGMMGYGGPGRTGGWYGPRGTSGLWILGTLVVVLLTAFVILTAVRLARRTATESPRDILLKRYASGQITREQCEQMKKDLTG